MRYGIEKVFLLDIKDNESLKTINLHKIIFVLLSLFNEFRQQVGGYFIHKTSNLLTLFINIKQKVKLRTFVSLYRVD